MIKFTKIAQASLLLLASTAFVQCSADGAADKSDAPKAKSEKVEKAGLKIAYVDGDSLMRGYNFAKDVNEAMLRAQNKLESAQRQKASQIQKFAGEIEQKYKSNGYLTEASFNADQQKLQKMQGEAESYMASLQRSAQNEMMMNTQQLNDSVDAYIKEYAKKKGYDAVFQKAATWFVGDAIDDVTADVIKGLNERYTKVDAKK